MEKVATSAPMIRLKFFMNLQFRRLVPHCIFLSVILLISFSPLLYKISHTPSGTVWGGGHKDITDYYSYISYIRQGRTELVQHNQMTNEEMPPKLTHPYYLLLGKIGSLTNISDIGMYYAGLCVPLIFYYAIMSKICRFLFPSRLYWIAMFFVFFAGPPPKEIFLFGTKLFSPVKYTSTMNLDAAGLDALSRMIPKPHYLVGTVFAWYSIYYFLKFHRFGKLRHAFLSGIFVSGGMVTYLMPVIFFLTAAFSLMVASFLNRWRQKKDISALMGKNGIRMLKGYGLLFLCGILSFLLLNRLFSDAYIVKNGTRLSMIQWETQAFSAKNTPFLDQFLKIGLLYIPYLPLAFLAGIYFCKRPEPENAFLLLMFIIPVTIYFATVREIVYFPYIRMFFPTAYVCFLLFTVSAFSCLHDLIPKTGTYMYIAGTILLLYGSYFAVSLKDYWTTEVQETYSPISGYIPIQYFPAFNYLNANSPKYSGVISRFPTGMLLVAFSHNKTYLSHEASTFNFSYKWWFNKSFMEGTLEPDRAKKLLDENRISYVFADTDTDYGRYEAFIKPVFKNGNIIIYKTEIL